MQLFYSHCKQKHSFIDCRDGLFTYEEFHVYNETTLCELNGMIFYKCNIHKNISKKIVASKCLKKKNIFIITLTIFKQHTSLCAE